MNELQALTALVRQKILDAVAGSAVDDIAATTGLEFSRVEEILAGDAPDGFEVMAFQVAYRRRMWPDGNDAEPLDGERSRTSEEYRR